MDDEESRVSEREKTQLIAGMFHTMRWRAKKRDYDPGGVVRKALAGWRKKQAEGSEQP